MAASRLRWLLDSSGQCRIQCMTFENQLKICLLGTALDPGPGPSIRSPVDSQNSFAGIAVSTGQQRKRFGQYRQGIRRRHYNCDIETVSHQP